jgi:hypothetical protein
MPVVLATQDAKNKRIMVQSHPRQTACWTLSRKTKQNKRAGRVAQVVECKGEALSAPVPPKKKKKKEKKF